MREQRHCDATGCTERWYADEETQTDDAGHGTMGRIVFVLSDGLVLVRACSPKCMVALAVSRAEQYAADEATKAAKKQAMAALIEAKPARAPEKAKRGR